MKVVVLRGVFSSRTRRRETHLSRSTLYAIIAELRIDQLGDVYASTTAINVSDKYLHNIIETSQNKYLYYAVYGSIAWVRAFVLKIARRILMA